MTQTTQILSHIKREGYITPLQALSLYGCMRLASRINDLRNSGHEINTTIIEQNEKRFAKYTIAK